MSKRKGPGKPITEPTICKKCAYKAATTTCQQCGHAHQPEASDVARIQQQLNTNELAGRIVWEVVGRAIEEANDGYCPTSCGYEMAEGWCEKECKRAGDKANKHWRCWTRWLGNHLARGRFRPEEIRKRIDEGAEK